MATVGTDVADAAAVAVDPHDMVSEYGMESESESEWRVSRM